MPAEQPSFLYQAAQGLYALLFHLSSMTVLAAVVSCRVCSCWRQRRQCCSLCGLILIKPSSWVPIAHAVWQLEMQRDALLLVRIDLLAEQDSVTG